MIYEEKIEIDAQKALNHLWRSIHKEFIEHNRATTTAITYYIIKLGFGK
ncbi:MAG: hypothetical protein ACFFDF_18455 [Candidatus Odinarchaeota archaeon]